MHVTFGRESSQKALREVHEKNKKTSRRSVTRVTKYCKKLQICTIWNSSADPTDSAVPGKVVAGRAARTPTSTRAGGQDDVS